MRSGSTLENRPLWKHVWECVTGWTGSTAALGTRNWRTRCTSNCTKDRSVLKIQTKCCSDCCIGGFLMVFDSLYFVACFSVRQDVSEDRGWQQEACFKSRSWQVNFWHAVDAIAQCETMWKPCWAMSFRWLTEWSLFFFSALKMFCWIHGFISRKFLLDSWQRIAKQQRSEKADAETKRKHQAEWLGHNSLSCRDFEIWQIESILI